MSECVGPKSSGSLAAAALDQTTGNGGNGGSDGRGVWSGWGGG